MGFRMYISKLKIKNFKVFKEVEINFDSNFNLIIGQNNSGKSTVFEALKLWNLAFGKFLKARTNSRQNSIFYAREYYSFTISEIEFLRISKFENLFNQTNHKTFEISISIKCDEKELSLPINFTLTSDGQILRFSLFKSTKERPEASGKIIEILGTKDKGISLRDMLLMTYINPLFHLPTKEPKYQKGFILEKLYHAKAHEVIRNLIEEGLKLAWQTSKNQEPRQESVELKELQSALNNILENNDDGNINFLSNLKKEEDSYIEILAKNNQKTKVEIAQLGSGPLNILNILAVLSYGDYEKYNLTALLLDEPDSHLHFNLQKNLFKHLEKESGDKNKQIFIVTHNSNLIAQFEQVIYLEHDKEKISPINIDDYLTSHVQNIDKGQFKAMTELRNAKKDLEIAQNIITQESKVTILFEGATDRDIFKTAYKKLYEKDLPYEINDKISSASQITTALTIHDCNLGFLIGIYDNDYTGKSQFNSLPKSFVKCNSDDRIKKNNNKFGMLLNIPDFRKEIDFYKEHLSVEYLFNDNDLQTILGEDFFQESGTTFKQIRKEKDKQVYTIKDALKNKIRDEVIKLDKDSFEAFKVIFEKIETLTRDND